MTETTRLERSKHTRPGPHGVGKRAARRDSFRSYWRENGASYYGRWPHSSRRTRRSLARAAWRAERVTG